MSIIYVLFLLIVCKFSGDRIVIFDLVPLMYGYCISLTGSESLHDSDAILSYS